MKITSFLNILEPAPFKPEIKDEQLVKRKYKYWRFRIFYSLFIGYTFFYFTRKSYTFAMPFMAQDLGYSAKELGILGTVLYIVYAASKFISGVTSDRSNPRYFMSIGLILTGVFNILFGLSSNIVLFALFWGLNGWFQGWGWPPITKQLTHWYSKSERGTWWSICGISHNVGGALIPILAAYCAGQFGWRYATLIPGVLCVLVGLFLIDRLRDIPQSLGLPPIEKFKNDINELSGDETPKNNAATNHSQLLSAKQILFEQVLTNKYVWMLAIAYFYVYVVRTAINDWSPLFLIQVKGYSKFAASSSIAWFEGGGLLGMLAAGWGTDKFLGGKRIPFMIGCSILMVLAVTMLNYSTINSMYFDYSLIGLIGFLVFGPQMLVGMIAAEAVDKKAACTANGFVGCAAYVGAAATGYPLGVIIDKSWNTYYIVLISCCIVLTLILSTMVLFTNRSAKLNQEKFA